MISQHLMVNQQIPEWPILFYFIILNHFIIFIYFPKIFCVLYIYIYINLFVYLFIYIAHYFRIANSKISSQ